MILQALNQLRPNCSVQIQSNDDGSYTILKYEHSEPQPTEKEINDKIAELKAEYDSKQYQRDRAVAYDPIPEQLDQIYHDMDGWKAKIKAVKDKYPKP